MTSNALFAPMFSTPEVAAAVSAGAWLRAMLRFETALADVCARHGLVPRESAEAIAAAMHATRFDPANLGELGLDAANPVVPFVAALRRAVPASAAGHVHFGATSQDVLDTAMMLVARDALDLAGRELDRAAAAAASLARGHRDTVMIGRTLLQQAAPTTFGLKAAGWLMGFLAAADGIARVRHERLAMQFGGSVGTLSAYGDSAPAIARDLAAELGLTVPTLPWHTERSRVAELGAALAIAAGAAGKAALDILLLAQTEVAEVREGGDANRGRSSAMPQKRNPVGAITALAASRRAQAVAPQLFAAMLQEHERAAGAWQSEWPALSDLFEASVAAITRIADVLETLEVDSEAMARNLGAGKGLAMAESVVAAMARKARGGDPRKLVDDAVGRALEQGTDLRQELDDPAVLAILSAAEIEAALDPRNAIGSAGPFVDAALAAFAARQETQP